MTAQAFFKKEKARNDIAGTGASNSIKKPFSTLGTSRFSASVATATVTSSSAPSPAPSFAVNQPYYNRFSNGSNSNANINRELPKPVIRPHPAMRNRFDTGPSKVELADVGHKYDEDEQIVECERTTKNMLGYIPSEQAEKLKAQDKTIKVCIYHSFFSFNKIENTFNKLQKTVQ